MKNKILIPFILFIHSFCFGQEQITWESLAQVTYTEKFFAHYDDYFLYPEFLPSVKELEGKQVILSGYFLSIDPELNLYILSKGPMSSCFFCGQGGPETAVELQFAEEPNFKTDDIVSVTGTLKLNKDDVEHFNYILKECQGILVE